MILNRAFEEIHVSADLALAAVALASSVGQYELRRRGAGERTRMVIVTAITTSAAAAPMGQTPKNMWVV